jgi:hypothetical protein
MGRVFPAFTSVLLAVCAAVGQCISDTYYTAVAAMLAQRYSIAAAMDDTLTVWELGPQCPLGLSAGLRQLARDSELFEVIHSSMQLIPSANGKPEECEAAATHYLYFPATGPFPYHAEPEYAANVVVSVDVYSLFPPEASGNADCCETGPLFIVNSFCGLSWQL